jgi:death on curing protein
VEPLFLTLDEAVAIHRDQIERYGGSLGVRDWGLLKSAIAMPAAYLFHIVQNHPFIDGNKRVGAVSADVFLALNDIRLTATEDEYADLVRSIARGETSKSGAAEFFKERCKAV